mgnify:CR=1 FL=1|jgi:flagellar basal-body rod protein FlgB
MIRELLFGQEGFRAQKAALDAGALRQRVISSNLANAATPGYRAQKVVFEELLQQERQHIPLTLTHQEHLPAAMEPPAGALVRPRGGEPDASGVNDVLVEQEMTELAKNTVHFQSVSQFLINSYKGVRDAIRPGA